MEVSFISKLVNNIWNVNEGMPRQRAELLNRFTSLSGEDCTLPYVRWQ
jgi:hypothetical protein